MFSVLNLFFDGWYCVVAGRRPVLLHLSCTNTTAQEKHLSVLWRAAGTLSKDTTVYIWSNAIWTTICHRSVLRSIFINMVDCCGLKRYKVVFCTFLDDCTYTVYWRKDVWNFIACLAYDGGLFDNFTFYISCLDCDMLRLSSWLFWVVNLPRIFYMNVSHGLWANIAGCPICFKYYIFTVYKMCICT